MYVNMLVLYIEKVGNSSGLWAKGLEYWHNIPFGTVQIFFVIYGLNENF